ncbi:ABC transporter ATP-binding protein [Labrys wisconsinensis]|uniref:Peptide/nickel transport system ATP-binding protein n=1 Tax=Labrys wisconsinensis TaxID=425677 RepID=A0ABU0IYD2_9HYPH|nr:ABC transporter ATP-binding protein [Labrys wisconsinensis]MDQ0467020.1 peptide/nickel transport system ATP-binding protein [Labrys wisconsinensis]
MSQPLLSVRDLDVEIETDTGPALAVAGVGFDLHPGEMLALVGESGCGKSMTALALMQLLPRPPARVTRGTIRIEGVDALALDARGLEDLRGRRIGMIFQEPMTSLNPVLTIERQMTEGLVRHFGLSAREARARAEAALADVRIVDPADVMRRHPHQLSGGMRQRVMIAAAIALEPAVLIADEPTTALDVTVQAQVLDLLAGLRDRGSAVLMITHDLGVVAETADRVAVMYAGRIVETADVAVVLGNPAHPYAQGLLASHLTPRAEPRAPGSFPPPLPVIPGTVPPLGRRPGGCAFRDRCPRAIPRCAEAPPLVEVGPGHAAACWRPFHG